MPDWNGLRADLRRLALRHRRVGAALLAGVAVLLLVGILAPDRAPGRLVVVVVRPLAAGTVLTPGDLRVVDVSAALVPDDAASDPARLAGRALAGPMAAGEILTDERLLGRSLLASSAPGSVAAAVRVRDPAQVAMLQIGDRIDVYAAGRDATIAARVLSHARVLALPLEDSTSATALAGAVVVVETTPASAARLAQASALFALFLTLDR